MDGSKSGAGRITHEVKSLQAREGAKRPFRDAREVVVVLLRDGESIGSEAAADTAHGEMGRAEVSNGWVRERGGAHNARDPETAGS